MPTVFRARGVLRTALTWGVGLAVLASTLLIGGVELGLVPANIYGIRELVAVAVRNFIAGGLAGGVFAMLMAYRERGRTFAQLSYGRLGTTGFVSAAMLGAFAFVAAPVALPATVFAAGTLGFGLLGAAFAAGSLALARRASSLPDHALQSGDDPMLRLPTSPRSSPSCPVASPSD